ncbi:MAG: zf-HC2 domain-containing protein [Candidatus Glassbacteria bacterium]|nr:zf-HC2 domain-containing protein [Candidatus Glassbacteria bacterium]
MKPALFASFKVRMMAFMMGSILPDCEEASRRVSAAMDARLSLSQRAGVRLHLMVCKFCSRYEKQLHLIRNAVRSDSAELEDSSVHLLPETRQRIQSAIRSSSDQD